MSLIRSPVTRKVSLVVAALAVALQSCPSVDEQAQSKMRPRRSLPGQARTSECETYVAYVRQVQDGGGDDGRLAQAVSTC